MITIKGCVQIKDLPELKEGMGKAIIAFVYNPDHLRLWPGEYVPATVTIEEAWRLPQKEEQYENHNKTVNQDFLPWVSFIKESTEEKGGGER